MVSNEVLLYEKQFDYDTLQKIRIHAEKYNQETDKKTFLRNVIPYEQKLILLNSTKPYEVLSYLDELDLRSTRLILKSLTKEEVKHMVGLFSSEDKKRFYTHFSDLDLVNQFITQDKNADEYIENLSFNRKVELLNSSDKKTEVATSKVYESMTYLEKEKAENRVTSADGISTLTNVSDEQQEVVVENEQSDQDINLIDIKVDEQVEEQPEERLEEIKPEEQVEQLKTDTPELEETQNLESEKVEKFQEASKQVENEYLEQVSLNLAPTILEDSVKTL